MIRASIPAADWTERHLPMPVQTALSQYGAWLERIRKSPKPEDAERQRMDLFDPAKYLLDSANVGEPEEAQDGFGGAAGQKRTSRSLAF
jgi:hypothetical protein